MPGAASAALSGLTFRLLVFKLFQQPRKLSTVRRGISKHLFKRLTHERLTFTQDHFFVSKERLNKG
jgi:hypothetical protein